MTAVIAPQIAIEILALVDASDGTDQALHKIAGDHGLMLPELRALMARRPGTVVRNVTAPANEPKVCSACNTTKPRTEFYPNPKTSDGLDSRCRSCNNTRPHTETRLLRNRARSRAYAQLAEAHREEFDRLYAAAYAEAQAEHTRIAAAAVAKGQSDAQVARIKRGPKRAEETDVVQRLDVARCPSCHTHHDADHVCPTCSEQTPAAAVATSTGQAS